MKILFQMTGSKVKHKRSCEEDSKESIKKIKVKDDQDGYVCGVSVEIFLLFTDIK